MGKPGGRAGAGDGRRPGRAGGGPRPGAGRGRVGGQAKGRAGNPFKKFPLNRYEIPPLPGAPPKAAPEGIFTQIKRKILKHPRPGPPGVIPPLN